MLEMPSSRNSFTTILQRQMGTFYAALGSRGISANPVDIKLVKRPPELCVTRTRDGAWLVDSEDAGLVAVERQRLAEALKILERCFEIRKRGLAAGESYDHQSTRGIVDVNDRGSHRSPFFEPPVLAAVDLDELAEAGTSCPRLLDLRRPKLAWDPQPGVHLNPPRVSLATVMP